MSTLQVENLIGPTSGANANKVIIPSGQTIDVSAGTLVPSAGAVVKVQTYELATSGEQTVASTSFVELTSWGTPTFTKTKSTNRLYCQLHYYNYYTASATYWWLKATVNGVNVSSNNGSGAFQQGTIDTHNSTQYVLNVAAHQAHHTHFWDDQDTSTAVFRFLTKGQASYQNSWWNDGNPKLVIMEIAQ